MFKRINIDTVVIPEINPNATLVVVNQSELHLEIAKSQVTILEGSGLTVQIKFWTIVFATRDLHCGVTNLDNRVRNVAPPRFDSGSNVNSQS